MDNKKKRFLSRLIMIYIIIQPILDAIAGISNNVSFFNFKINIVIRGLFLLIVGVYLIFICKNKYRKFNLVYLGMLFLYYIFYGYFTYIYKDNSLLFFEFKQSILSYYFPITLLALFNMSEEKIIKFKSKYLVIALFIYLCLIIIPNIFGISFNAYDDGVGTLGLFNSANSISAILSMLLPCAIIYFKNNIKLLIGFLLFFCLCIFLMGTKTVILSFLIVLFINFVYYISKSRKKLDTKKKILLLVVIFTVIVSAIFIVPKTAVFKNIKRRIEFLEIKDANDVIDNFDALVMSRRFKYLKSVHKFYRKVEFPQKLVGIGYANTGIKLVEMDYFDLFYCHGILGFIIYFIPVIYIFRVNHEVRKKDFIYINQFSSLLIVLLTSFLTGHVLIEPNASFYVAILIIMFNQKKSYDL